MEQKNLEIQKATSESYKITFKDDTGLSKDITDWTVYFTVKEKMSDADSASKINIVQTIHDYPTLGITILTLDSTDTNIDSGNYWYSIDYKDDDGNSKVIASGFLKIKDTVRTERG